MLFSGAADNNPFDKDIGIEKETSLPEISNLTQEDLEFLNQDEKAYVEMAKVDCENGCLGSKSCICAVVSARNSTASGPSVQVTLMVFFLLQNNWPLELFCVNFKSVF